MPRSRPEWSLGHDGGYPIAKPGRKTPNSVRASYVRALSTRRSADKLCGSMSSARGRSFDYPHNSGGTEFLGIRACEPRQTPRTPSSCRVAFSPKSLSCLVSFWLANIDFFARASSLSRLLLIAFGDRGVNRIQMLGLPSSLTALRSPIRSRATGGVCCGYRHSSGVTRLVRGRNITRGTTRPGCADSLDQWRSVCACSSTRAQIMPCAASGTGWRSEVWRHFDRTRIGDTAHTCPMSHCFDGTLTRSGMSLRPFPIEVRSNSPSTRSRPFVAAGPSSCRPRQRVSCYGSRP